MLNKDEQQISNISNSTINQAKGNIINYGPSVKDVIDIVNNVVADKMVIFQKEAEDTAKQRLDDFNKKLMNELQDKAEEQIEKFNMPAIQLAARKAAWGYVQNGDENDKDDLVDLLIERVAVEEKTTKQHLIDEAIEILPSLSANCLNLLTFLAFSTLTRKGTVSDYEKWINCINPIINKLSSISSLDVDFLNQADCTFNTIGFRSSSSFIDNQLKTCDLLFRHRPLQNFADKLIEKYPLTHTENGFLFKGRGEMQKFITLIELFGMMNYPEVKMKYTTLSTISDVLKKSGYSDFANDLQDYYDQTQPYTIEEVEQYFFDKNPRWHEALDLLGRDDIASLRLKPVGTYIACRQIKKLAGEEISIDIFYK